MYVTVLNYVINTKTLDIYLLNKLFNPGFIEVNSFSIFFNKYRKAPLVKNHVCY